MKPNKTRSLLAALVLCAALLAPLQGAAAGYTAREVHDSMLALQSTYYEGRRWTNSNYYAWKGGIFTGGYGCAGFAFALSDAAFGNLQARKVTKIDYPSLRVGDILRVNGNSHSVVIIEKYDDFVVIAEGNYGSTIHWGRTMTRADVLKADYYMTRYPNNTSGRGPVCETLRLPDALREIGKGAFANTDAEIVIIPVTCETIREDAFRDCAALRTVYICYDTYGPTIYEGAFGEDVDISYVDFG